MSNTVSQWLHVCDVCRFKQSLLNQHTLTNESVLWWSNMMNASRQLTLDVSLPQRNPNSLEWFHVQYCYLVHNKWVFFINNVCLLDCIKLIIEFKARHSTFEKNIEKINMYSMKIWKHDIVSQHWNTGYKVSQHMK